MDLFRRIFRSYIVGDIKEFKRCYAFSLIVLLLSFIFSYNAEYVQEIFNADLLHLPVLYKDIFVDRFSFLGWRLSSAPFFFPDMLVYFIANSIFANFKYAVLVYSILQIFLFTLSFQYLLRTVFSNDKLLTDIYAVLITAVIICLMPSITGFATLLYPVQHVGSLILSLLSLTLLIKILKDDLGFHYFLFFLICCLGILSDRIFLASFGISAFFTVIVLYIFRLISFKKNIKILTLIVASSVAADIILVLLDHLVAPALTFHNAANLYTGMQFRSHLFMASLKNLCAIFFSRKYSFFLWLWTLWIILSVAPFLSFKKIRDKTKLCRQNVEIKTITIFSMVMVLTNILCITITARYQCSAHNRYLLFPLFFPFIGCTMYAFILFRKILMKRISIAALMGVVFAFIIGNLVFLNNNISAVISYEKPLAKCLDENQEKYGLSYGISDYWRAKPVTMLSKKNIKVNQCDPDGHAFHFQNNLAWYYENNKDNHGSPIYNFVILDNLDESSVIRSFGKPSHALMCGNSKVIVYDENTSFNSDLKKRLYDDFDESLVKRALR